MAPACGKLSLQRYPPTNRSKSSSGTRRSTADDFSAVCLDSAPELGPTSILSEPSSSAQLQAQALDSDGESDNVNSATPKRTKRQEHTRNNASKYVDLAEDRMHELGVTWDYRRASSVKNFGVLAANDLNLSLTQKHTIAAQQAGVSERSLYKYIHEVDEKGKFISVDGRGKRTQERDLLHDEELKMKLVTFLRANAGVKKQEKTLPQKLHNYVNEQLREYPALKLHWLKKQAQPLMREGWFIKNGERVTQKMHQDGVAKGLKKVLEERGLLKEGMLKADMIKVLEQQPDFKEQKPMLQEWIERRGHVCIFFPKFHPELSFIEMVWSSWKRLLRRRCDYTMEGLRKNVVQCLKAIGVQEMRAFERHCQRYVQAYREGHSGYTAAAAIKEYRSHRRVSANVDLQALQHS